jgi:hypothetical protein
VEAQIGSQLLGKGLQIIPWLAVRAGHLAREAAHVDQVKTNAGAQALGSLLPGFGGRSKSMQQQKIARALADDFRGEEFAVVRSRGTFEKAG